MRRLGAVLLVALVVASGTASAAGPTLTVFGAASLTDVLTKIAPGERYSFAGSNTLAAQIQLGAPADVFASANLSIPEQLYAKGLVTRPYVFTRNALVLIVPRSNPAHIHSVRDLENSDVKLVIAAPAVPAGSYTLTALKNMGMTRVLDNVVSRETDVREVLAKVALGVADAGFVYATDARTVGKRVATFRLPAAARPNVAYGVAAVKSSSHLAAAQSYVRMLLGKRAQARLVAAGFLPRRRS